MKKNLLLSAVLLGCLSASAPAQQPAPEVPPVPAEPVTRSARETTRFIRLEKCAYLGVATSPAPQALRQQVELPAGVGLVVDAVAPESPATAAGLKKHDLLHKINDQLLINPQQLAVLVRTFKPGDVVKLTIIRAGKPIELLATLIEKELPPLDELRFGFEDPMRLMEERLEELRSRTPAPPIDHQDEAAPPRPKGLLNEGVVFSWEDGGIAMQVTVTNGKRVLVARDKVGKELFNGPIDTEAQRNAVPAEVREVLAKMDLPAQ